MNSLVSFYERLHGFRNSFNYDFALTRLCVKKEDSWKGITPSNYSPDYNPEPPIFSAKFASCNNFKHFLAIANEDGKIALQDTSKRNLDYDEKALEGQQCHFNAVFDLEWAPGQMKFVSASGDHTARLWDIKDGDIVQTRSFTGHTRSVKTAAFRKNDQAVFATGGRDGAILIWDTRAVLNVDLGTTRADNCIYSGHGPGTPVSNRKRIVRTPKLSTSTITSSITGLVFQDDNTLVSCGAGDGVIKIWDLRRNYTCFKREPLPKYSLPYAGNSTFKGFTNLLCDDSGNRLYANCMDNSIYCYNLASYSSKPIQKYTGLRNNTFYIKSCLSPDGQYLVSGSSDEKAYVWNINNSKPLLSLHGHTVEVTCVAWSSANDMPIVTCSDDARHKIWRIGPEHIPDDEKIDYKGHAEYFTDYLKTNLDTKSNSIKDRLQCLDSTPRSLKRIVEENEKTPTTVEKINGKRSYSEVDECANNNYESEPKRPHIETRGRRLFSPCPSYVHVESPASMNFCPILESIPESQLQLSPNFDSKYENNQENSLLCQKNDSSPTLNTNQKLSPLSERINSNIASPSVSSYSRHSLQQSGIFSPTSNLPNYVIDGEAPHLGIMSPKRKSKDKIDWLTKIRKQKLMNRNFPSSLNEKLVGNSSANLENCDIVQQHNGAGKMEHDLFSHHNSSSYPNSPKSSNTYGTPKRRLSRSGSHCGDSSRSKTPTSNRRNSETTILRFFTAITHQSSSTQSLNHIDEPTNLNSSNNASVATITTA